MSSPSPEKIAANIANAQLSTGPRTEAGQAASAKNALKSGLFATKDFIRPGEESAYDELTETLNCDLIPVGQLELNLADEIRRAMWRLRRCADVESALVDTCAQLDAVGAEPAADRPIPDPMQNEATARLQSSVDRARAQCHRLLHRCTSELRKLQTERHMRHETSDAGDDLSWLGVVADFRAIRKAIDEGATHDERIFEREKRLNATLAKARLDFMLADPVLPPALSPAPVAKQTQPSRNSRCACGSGQKYKRCCGRHAAPMPQAA